MALAASAEAEWGASDLIFTRIGSRVFVDGVLIRSSESSGAITSLGIGYATGPYLPAPWYGGNTVSSYPGSVSLRGVGLTSSSGSVTAIVRIRASGFVDLITLGAVKEVRVSGSYRMKDYPVLNTLEFPQFEGTYFKRWMDKYGMVEGVNFDTFHRYGTDPRLVSLAIHGGENGAREVAVRLADIMGSSLYYMDQRQGFYNLTHLSSNGFDDPRCVPLVRAANRCISMHGASNRNEWGTGLYSYVGGRDEPFRKAVIAKLEGAGFPCVDAFENIPDISGAGAANICNIGPNGGVQIEMNNSLRRALFTGNDYSRENRENTTPIFETYCQLLADVARDFIAS